MQAVAPVLHVPSPQPVAPAHSLQEPQCGFRQRPTHAPLQAPTLSSVGWSQYSSRVRALLFTLFPALSKNWATNDRFDLGPTNSMVLAALRRDHVTDNVNVLFS